jgi:Transcriptional regulators
MNEKIWNLFFDNLQKILFPEVWLIMDSSVSKMELMALLLLWRNGETIMTQLADSINIPMSTATGIVGRLAKKGYVDRITDETNRRIVTVRITQKGIDTAESMKQTVIKYWDIFTKILTNDEKETIYKLFSKVVDLFDKTELENVVNEQSIKKIHIE